MMVHMMVHMVVHMMVHMVVHMVVHVTLMRARDHAHSASQPRVHRITRVPKRMVEYAIQG